MDAGTWVALIASLLAATVAVVVPWAAFRFAIRQDHVRWVREQRFELYMGMLTEAYAEQEWLKTETAPPGIQEAARKFFVDKRLAPAKRPARSQGIDHREPTRQPVVQSDQQPGVHAWLATTLGGSWLLLFEVTIGPTCPLGPCCIPEAKHGTSDFQLGITREIALAVKRDSRQ